MENFKAFVNPNVKAPVIISCTHPDNKRDFRASAVSKSQRKVMKEGLAYVCTVCGNDGSDGVKLPDVRIPGTVRRSVRSKIAHPPCCRQSHKPNCHKEDHQRNKLITNVITNVVLLSFIQMALALNYDLHNKPRPEKPLVARCDLSIDPADMIYMPLFLTGGIARGDMNKGTEGMVQAQRITELNPADALDDARMEMWRKEKQSLKQRGFSNDHVVVVYFYVSGVTPGRFASLWIPDIILQRVKSGEGFEMKSAISGTMTLPLSVDSCLTAFNTHIRSDKGNKLQLREHMSQEDVEKYIAQIRSRDNDRP